MNIDAGPVGSSRTIMTALSADDGAPARARRHLAEHSAGMAPRVIDDAMLLVSELVTNAVCHGRPDILLTVHLRSTGIGVAVRDRGPALPVLPREMPGPNALSGRGLRLVETLSSDWGVLPLDPPPGKTVWFELDSRSVAELQR